MNEKIKAAAAHNLILKPKDEKKKKMNLTQKNSDYFSCVEEQFSKIEQKKFWKPEKN